MKQLDDYDSDDSQEEQQKKIAKKAAHMTVVQEQTLEEVEYSSDEEGREDPKELDDVTLTREFSRDEKIHPIGSRLSIKHRVQNIDAQSTSSMAGVSMADVSLGPDTESMAGLSMADVSVTGLDNISMAGPDTISMASPEVMSMAGPETTSMA